MRYIIKYLPLFFVSCLLVSALSASSKDEKYRARISLERVKVMNDQSYINISVKYKGEDGFEPANDLTLSVYRRVNEDSLVSLGQVITNSDGMAKFLMEDVIKTFDTTGVYSYTVAIEDDERFRDADKTISFSEANLLIKIIMIDSVYDISATLTDEKGDYLPRGVPSSRP